MSDQAERLRRLLANEGERSPRASAATITDTTTRTVLVVGGKGGAGASNLALGLAVGLSQRGSRVTLIDADLGRANIDLLCGLAPARDLHDVFGGECRLADAATEGPAGLKFIAGTHAIRGVDSRDGDDAPDTAEALAGSLESLHAQTDFLLIDAGHGLERHAAALARVADEIIVVATPEPTARADTQAVLRRLGTPDGACLRVVVNQARSGSEARESLDRFASDGRAYFGLVVRPLGFVPYDPRVPRAVRRRVPLLLDAPTAPASRALGRIARQLHDEHAPEAAPRSSLLGLLAAHWAPRRQPALE